ncbi:hypothetical protein [Cupriavidus campinensis]|uniref:Uncharacterized protein n=1 Tax=Cupriavidus campinensis TaxID=151783 RepID=A0ABY3ESX4_9BURK|nr:hypothetical protein [Cupriavidus campinensis]TSP14047.1 hypothetical protein FGG12_06140 [Cupriavidus campinensis]
MSECDEVAEAMLPRFMRWVRACAENRSMDAARIFVRSQMPDESSAIVGNVAWTLHRMAKPSINEQDATNDH